MGSTVLGKVLGLQKLCEQYENAAADTYRNTFEQNFWTLEIVEIIST